MNVPKGDSLETINRDSVESILAGYLRRVQQVLPYNFCDFALGGDDIIFEGKCENGVLTLIKLVDYRSGTDKRAWLWYNSDYIFFHDSPGYDIRGINLWGNGEVHSFMNGKENGNENTISTQHTNILRGVVDYIHETLVCLIPTEDNIKSSTRNNSVWKSKTRVYWKIDYQTEDRANLTINYSYSE